MSRDFQRDSSRKTVHVHPIPTKQPTHPHIVDSHESSVVLSSRPETPNDDVHWNFGTY